MQCVLAQAAHTQSLAGAFALSGASSFATLDPQTDGARVLIKNEAGVTRIDVTLPGGAYGGSGTRGWTLNSKGTKWTYQDKTGTPNNGITKLTFEDRNKAPNQVKVAVTGKNGTYPVVSGDEPLAATVVLGNQAASAAGECTETTFGPGTCSFNGSGSKLVCKP